MLISETCKVTGLTKKAIEYYAEQQLIFPVTMENGYKDYTPSDVERLKRISVLRKLGLGVHEIRAVLADAKGNAIKQISVQKVLTLQEEQMKKDMLDELVQGKSYDEIAIRLESLEKHGTVAQKLLEAFPGFYGRFICLHFARFLNEPILTDEQIIACREILSFLDNVPKLEFPEELQTYLDECAEGISEEDIDELLENVKLSLKDPESFLNSNKESLEQYFAFKTSSDYIDSPLHKTEVLLRNFTSTNGYYDTFIPAMKKLSISYAEYCGQMDTANEKLLALYPELAKLNVQTE
jgi:DNA-binding transcriptional MerR regulator